MPSFASFEKLSRSGWGFFKPFNIRSSAILLFFSESESDIKIFASIERSLHNSQLIMQENRLTQIDLSEHNGDRTRMTWG